MVLLVVDNGSRYTPRLVDHLHSLAVEFVKLPYHKTKPSSVQNYTGVILSGRMQNDKAMNATNSKIILNCVSNQKMLLGICYGAEILALAVGGTIRRMESLHKGQDTVSVTKQSLLWDKKDNETIRVYQSHLYKISSLGSQALHQLGSSDVCEYEIVQYKDYHIFGTQFHPEMTDDGRELITNFVFSKR